MHDEESETGACTTAACASVSRQLQNNEQDEDDDDDHCISSSSSYNLQLGLTWGELSQMQSTWGVQEGRAADIFLPRHPYLYDLEWQQPQQQQEAETVEQVLSEFPVLPAVVLSLHPDFMQSSDQESPVNEGEQQQQEDEDEWGDSGASSAPEPESSPLAAVDTCRANAKRLRHASSLPERTTKRQRSTAADATPTTAALGAAAGGHENDGDNDDQYTNDEQNKIMEPLPTDVIMGRGGRANNHVGNGRFHEEKMRLREEYRNATKEQKTVISQRLVDTVYANGGRFMHFDKEKCQWHEADNGTARKKASQALREAFVTVQDRMEKSKRYKQQQAKSGKSKIPCPKVETTQDLP